MSERKIPVECWTRVVGYFRPVKDCNHGKKAEINDRATFDANAYCNREFGSQEKSA